MNIIVASRDSKLAVIQAEMVINSIKQTDKTITTQLLTMKTTGDLILDKTLDKIGGKGLFVKELDKALLEDKAHLTVHSFKDMPMEENEEIPIVAVSVREDPRDVLILPLGKTQIDFSKPIGCSSARRAIQLKTIFPQCTIEPIRGNVQTRLKKLDSGEFGATVLAYAGIKRLGLEERVSRIFTIDEMLPACCQGILAVQGKAGFNTSCLAEFHSPDTYIIALAERSFVRTLNGGCSSPVAAYATINGETLTLTGMYVNENNSYFKETVTGNKNDGEILGENLAIFMKEKFSN